MQWGKLLKKGKKNKVIQTFLNKHKKNVKKESVQKKVPFFKGIKTLQQLVHLSKPKKAITSDSSIVDIEKTTTDLVTSSPLQVQGTDMKQPGVKFSPSFGFNKLRRQLQEKTVKSPFKLQKFKQNKAALKSTIKEIQGKEEPSSAITTATKLSFPRSFGISKIKQKLSSLKISKKKRKRSGKLLWTVVQKKMMRKQSIFDVVVKKKFNWTFNTPTSPKLPIFSLKKRNLKKFTNLKKVQNLMKLKVFSSSVQKQNIPTSLPDKEWRKVRKYLQVGAASQEILTSLRKVSIAKTLRLSGKSLVQRVIRRMRQVPVDPAFRYVGRLKKICSTGKFISCFSVQSSSIRGSISIIDAAEEQRKVACHTVALRFMEDYILETAFTKRLHFYSTRATQIQSQVRRRQAVFRCIILKREKVANELYTFSMLVQKENTAQILHARQRHAAVHLQRLWRGIKGRQRFQRQTIRFVERRKRQIQRNRLQAARKSLGMFLQSLPLKNTTAANLFSYSYNR